MGPVLFCAIQALVNAGGRCGMWDAHSLLSQYELESEQGGVEQSDLSESK